MTTSLRARLAGILATLGGLGVLVWTIRAWWRRRHREDTLLELGLASERAQAEMTTDVAGALMRAQERDREAKARVAEADAEIAKRRPKVITAESVESRMKGRP